jgi:hypothetical protein
MDRLTAAELALIKTMGYDVRKLWNGKWIAYVVETGHRVGIDQYTKRDAQHTALAQAENDAAHRAAGSY